jgi:hypothetical protein
LEILWRHPSYTVDVVPKQYSDGKSLHGIHHLDSNVFIPFHLNGCISYFLSWLPSDKEVNQCWWITFTSDAEWQPYSDHFSKAEKAAKKYFQYPDPTHLHFNHNGEQLNGRMIKSTILMDDLIDPACLPLTIPLIGLWLQPVVPFIEQIFPLKH